MRYSVKPRDEIYVKGYGFWSFARNMGRNVINKHSQKLLDTDKISIRDSTKTALKRAIQNTTDAPGDLIS